MRAWSRQRLLCIAISLMSLVAPSLAQAEADSGIPTKAKGKLGQAIATDATDGTWEIFGFTDGSDAGPAGSRSLFHEAILRAGHDLGGFGTSTGAAYSPTNRAAVWLGVDTSWEQADTPLPQGASAGVGPSAGAKYQFLSRERSAVGLAAQWSFSWEAAKGNDQPYNILAHEFRLLADWQPAPEWFAAINLAYAPELDIYPNVSAERTHTVEVSGAVTKRVHGRYFLGAEVRHLVRYQSAFDGLEERAVYIGPTVLARFDTGYLGLACSIRIAADGPGPYSFGAQQFRLKAGLAF